MSESISITKSTIDVEDTKTEQQAALEDEICFIGYVLDSYCIDRGTLLDGYETESLVEPQLHSIHCLADVPRCVHSGYQMLLDPPIRSGTVAVGDYNKYCRALELDGNGNQLMLDLARSTGDQGYCSTCSGPPGSITSGFRATVYGKIVGGTSHPPLIQVTRVQSDRDGCQGTPPYEPPLDSLNCSSGSYLPFVAAHGSLMLISWGFLIPLGIVSARLLRHFPNSLWFQVHRVVQPLGIITALAGWITALAGPFNVLGSGVYDAQFVHAVLGSSVMGLGLLQPINAYLRPHKQVETDSDDDNYNYNFPDETSLKQRRYWEWGHKTIGYLATFLGMVNCFIGMALSGKYQEKYFQALFVAWGSVALYGVVLGLHRCWVFRREELLEGNVVDQVADDPLEGIHE
jgi:hypothetical protein